MTTMTLRPFADIYATAVLHKGGKAALESLMPQVLSPQELINTSDDRILSTLCLRVFRAGLTHSMVDKRWPDFEKALHNFDPFYCTMLSDEQFDDLMANTALIRHYRKMRSIRENAQLIRHLSQKHNGCGRFLAEWPSDDIVSLWLLFKKQGSQLGGRSAQSFLRMLGRDTFYLSADVVAVLINEGVFSESLRGKTPTAQRDLYAAQRAFNQWQQESGRSLSHISRIVSCTAS